MGRYTFYIFVSDDAANAPASVVHAGVVFACNKTLQPLLNAPVSQTAYTASKPLDIFIYEKAQVGSLQLRIQFSHMGKWAAVNDTNGDRVY